MALTRTYRAQGCRISGALEVVGQRWTLLIAHEALHGTRRFSDFKAALGIASNVLQSRLEFLVETDIMRRRESRPGSRHFEYELTSKGRDLWLVLAALTQWSEAHLQWDDGPPSTLGHEGRGGPATATDGCSACDAELPAPHDEAVRRPNGRRNSKP